MNHQVDALERCAAGGKCCCHPFNRGRRRAVASGRGCGTGGPSENLPSGAHAVGPPGSLGRLHLVNGAAGGQCMSCLMRRIAIAIAFAVIAPAAAHAQAAIAGVVKDGSGAVLPGVTVEAASPALIEKVRAGRERRHRSVPDRESPARHLLGDFHADRIQHRPSATASSWWAR